VTQKRESFKATAAGIDPARAHFVDEAGTHVAMTRDYARAARGERVFEHVPRNRGTVTTMIASLCSQGIEAVCTFVGGTTGDRFVAYTRDHLVPRLQPGDVVVWDGLTAHRNPRVRELIENAGASIVVLPPYSPDMNPIEFAWSLVKRSLRSAKIRDVAALPAAIGDACAAVSGEIASALIRHCGFGAQA
jgi:transposase